MTTKQVADELISMCRKGLVEEAKEKFFSDNIKSIEPREGLLPKEVQGMDAIRKKASLFILHVDNFYGSTISEPLVAGNYFSIIWETDLQMKNEQRKTDIELCVYETKDDKIISERFFY